MIDTTDGQQKKTVSAGVEASNDATELLFWELEVNDDNFFNARGHKQEGL